MKILYVVFTIFSICFALFAPLLSWIGETTMLAVSIISMLLCALCAVSCKQSIEGKEPLIKLFRQRPKKTIIPPGMCHNCGAIVPEGGMFCNKCGERLPAEKKDVVNIEEGMCYKCGEFVIPGDKYCIYCGAKQDVSDFIKHIERETSKENNITFCPRCGSRDLKLYREGYNYNEAYWSRVFGVKGGGYAAGMKSNLTRCRCMNCGKDWRTKYDYRLINK
ncbi:MAG: zinc ribbon domain-containing protein [Clostridia bacterium]|nr:zinc ribbon domain-containing protein [Clostridia bacterium]